MKNQSAFPVFDVHRCTGELGCSDTGMSLCDYFAGQALVGMFIGRVGIDLLPSKVATMAYEYSRAMVKERNRVLAELSAENMQ